MLIKNQSEPGKPKMYSPKHVKLHLGCGTNYKEGYVNVDSSPFVHKDLEWDLDLSPWPFKDNSVDYILANAVIEHLSDFKLFMEEAHRILKTGGELYFRVPLAFTHVDSKDTTHKQHLTPDSFNHFTKGGKRSIITKANFKGEIWVTPLLFHGLRFHRSFYYLNSLINNIFTGVEGRLRKV